jgi:ABC-type amino acid transport substrate-binding protein
MAKRHSNLNTLDVLKERWHIFAAFILIVIGIVVFTPLFNAHLHNNGINILNIININGDTSKKSMYLVGISQEEVPPFLTYNEGVPTGIDVDILKWISNDVEIDIAFVPMSTFEDGLNALRNEEIDMLMSGISITPKRMEEFLFSNPYMSTEQQIGVLRESSLTLNDFYAGPGLIGANIGSTSYEVVHNLFIDPSRVHQINGVVQVTKDLVSGKLDFMVTEQPMMAILAQEYPLRIIGSIFTGEEYGIVFRKDNIALQKMINISLKKLLESPDWKTIQVKYRPSQL